MGSVPVLLFRGAEIRTTHVTGLMTDIGTELGRLMYWHGSGTHRGRLRVLSLLATGFFLGGLAGAFGFRYFDYLSTVPRAVMLVAVAFVPAVDYLLRR